ncbi:MAG: NADAR family protein [Hyphomicrobiaceae bacterium]|nr:NADAR family protein [Hyphomicrobiaceae bacterium]
MSTVDTSRIISRGTLLDAIAAGWEPQYLPFWGHTAKVPGIGKHVLSQWWPAPFVVSAETFKSAEHYMMAAKARLFADEVARPKILAAPTPREAKALGRKVRGFNEEVWAEQRFEIVVEASIEKFGQNSELGAYLLKTGDAVLLEASPVDRVWGIGLAADDPRAMRPGQWRGLNLLGFALMRARTALKTGLRQVGTGRPGLIPL